MTKVVSTPDPDIPDSFAWRQASHILFCPSLDSAKAFINNHHSSFPDSRRLLCIPIGLIPSKAVIQAYNPRLKNKKIILLMPDDLLGRIADIKLAAWLRNNNVQLTYCQPGTIQIAFKNKTYHFPEHKTSLSAFEKASGFRSKIRTYKISVPNPNVYSASGPRTS